MNKRNIFYWSLYDFANSIFMIVFFLYFAQWLVVDKGVADFWYNAIFAVGSVLLLVTAPILGGIADKTQSQHRCLNVITILTVLSVLVVTYIALFSPQKVFLAALFFLITNYFYQFSFVFYNALLHDIAPPERWGWVSGVGQAGNWLGQIVGLLIALPFASGAVYLVGATGRAQTFFPSVILFVVLALPMLLLFRLPRSVSQPVRIDVREEYRSQWHQLKELVKTPDMKLFLLAYFFFNDAVVTAANNFPIYMQNVFEVSDSTKSAVLVGILVTSVVGALCSGWVADTIGLKKTLISILFGFAVIFPALGMVNHLPTFIVVTMLMGFFYGSIWTVTRAVMTTLTPKEKLNFGFSYYTIAERVSTFVGPLTWGLITSLLVDLGSMRYRLAVISITFFVLVGLYFVDRMHMDALSCDS
ncbi:MAG: MFS transporter [Candidatus Peribacteraceae bacterium]|nr:MFS transporter [Candidatus Peribacteraceae bacterium]